MLMLHKHIFGYHPGWTHRRHCLFTAW